MTKAGTTLQIVGRYSRSGSELAGGKVSLSNLARILGEPSLSQTWALLVPGSDAAPYDGFLNTLRIEVDDSLQLVKVARIFEEIVITGAKAQLKTLRYEIDALLSRNRFNGDRKEPAHIHIEHHDGHPWLERDGEPLVVELEEA